MIFAARHAPLSLDGVCYGASEVKASLPAREAARLVAERLPADLSADLVWSSHLSRCVEPAQVLAARYGAPLRVEPRLAELDFGEWEGRRWSDLQAHDAARLERWMKSWLDEGPPGGESARALEARTRDVLTELDDGRCHLLIVHAGVIRALRVVVRGVDWPTVMGQSVPFLTPERFDP